MVVAPVYPYCGVAAASSRRPAPALVTPVVPGVVNPAVTIKSLVVPAAAVAPCVTVSVGLAPSRFQMPWPRISAGPLASELATRLLSSVIELFKARLMLPPVRVTRPVTATLAPAPGADAFTNPSVMVSVPLICAVSPTPGKSRAPPLLMTTGPFTVKAPPPPAITPVLATPPVTVKPLIACVLWFRSKSPSFRTRTVLAGLIWPAALAPVVVLASSCTVGAPAEPAVADAAEADEMTDPTLPAGACAVRTTPVIGVTATVLPRPGIETTIVVGEVAVTLTKLTPRAALRAAWIAAAS